MGLYAGLTGINAYHQPGVEAGKKAAGRTLALQKDLPAVLPSSPGEYLTAEEWAVRVDKPDMAGEALWLLEDLAANPGRGVRLRSRSPVTETRFCFDG